MSKGEIFKLVWRGWFAGATVLFLPLFILMAAFMPEAPKNIWLAVVMVPFISALQGVMIGGLVLLGLLVWPPKKA